MGLTFAERRRKMRFITTFMGFDDPGELIYSYKDKPMVPGICIEMFCDGVSLVERDEEAGFCWECGEDSIQSVLIFSCIN